jgi:hypothetical protein
MPFRSFLLAHASGARESQDPSPCWRPCRAAVRRGSGRGFLNKLVVIGGSLVHGQGLELSLSVSLLVKEMGKMGISLLLLVGAQIYSKGACKLLLRM